MTAPLAAEARIVLERLVYLQKIRTTVLAAFGPGPARARLRNALVTRHVAAKLDREVSNALGHDVIQAMRQGGWRQVKHSNAIWWKGVQRL